MVEQRTPLLSRAASFLIREAMVQTPNSHFNDLDVKVNARSSWELMMGNCQGVKVSSGKFKFGLLQAQRMRVDTNEIVIKTKDMFQRPLEFTHDVRINIDLTFSRLDLAEGELLRNIVNEMVKELILAGISGAMGRWLPREIGGLHFSLGSIYIDYDSLMVETVFKLSDGSKFCMKIRTGFRVSNGGRVVSFRNPVLLIEEPFLGNTIPIPFLTVALVGIDLGPDVTVKELSIFDNQMRIRAHVTIPKDIFGRLMSGAPKVHIPLRSVLPGS